MKRLFAYVLFLCSVVLFGSTLMLQQHQLLMDGAASECGHALRGELADANEQDDFFSPFNPAEFLPIVMELPR